MKQFTKRYLSRMLDREPRSWPGLQCAIPRKIEYEPRSRQGTIYMNSGMCTDAAGAIALFTAIDPDVLTIVTIAGEKLDTVYRRGSISRAWQSFQGKTGASL
jgi:hypothetical protein